MQTLNYDVIVVGGGHAGCEAAHASAKIGAKTLLITMDMNKIGQMSCNPAIGGIAKGQIVREIDALGGGMGIVTDATAIQFRMLNLSKGPAMWSPRAQCDRGRYIWKWREVLDHTDNLDIWQDQVCKLITEGDHIKGVETIWGVTILAPSVIITAGTFLNGLMHIGRRMVPGGRCAEPHVTELTECINALGIKSARMKTGTPVRIDKRSVHFEDTAQQDGDNTGNKETDGYFSYLNPNGDFAENSYCKATREQFLPQLPCWTFYTNKEVHDTLNSGLADSPLFNGQIQSTGPRYCPSIETKLVTFPDKDQHPLFLEPEGVDTNEMYLNGFSSSMPMDIQIDAIHKIPALRDAKVYRPGYAIEYDYFDPTQLDHSLMSKKVKGLFFAGQVNGTTGYEEAAGQGLMAGVNAALYTGHHGSSLSSTSFNPFILHRDEAYIGVLIDDLVTKGVDEPYRMFTSRAEYRILLRQDDADARLTEKSHTIGLASNERLQWWLTKKNHIKDIIDFCETTNIKPKEVNNYLESIDSTPLHYGCKLQELVARPGIKIECLAEHLPRLKSLTDSFDNRKKEIIEASEVLVKYRGYIEREKQTAEKMHRLENIRIKGHFQYEELNGLSTEARQKLKKINPETLAQASRIPGVSPSDINVLLVLMGR